MFTGALILEGDVLLLYFLGDKWVFAADFIRPMGLLGISIVLKGLYTIISMSENKMKEQNILVSISIVILVFIIGYSKIFTIESQAFVYIYSIVMFFSG